MITRVPFMSLVPGPDTEVLRDAMARVVARGWFILGPEMEAFESEFAAASGGGHAVAVGSGTDALALTLRALDIGPGDEVITSPMSAAFSALAIVMAGATPVFADIDPDRLTLDPAATAAAVTARTKAIMPVHLYGQPADMVSLKAVADRHGLTVVEDACQAHFATCAGQPVGRFGAAAAFSFYPTKNLGALGDGGLVLTQDASLAARLQRLRNGGQSEKYRHVEFGVNSRMDELQAAVLRARLAFLPQWTARRRAIAVSYRDALTASPVGVPPECDSGHVYHLFPVLTPDREAFQRYLADRGIGTLVHYPIALTKQPALASYATALCPVAERIAREVCSLPLHPQLSDADASIVVEAVHAFGVRA